jgi:hypothetical protein
MKSYLLCSVLACSALSALLVLRAPAQDETVPPKGVEVLASGPIHEAYAQPTNDQPQPGLIEPREPPAPIDELPPDQKPDGNNVQWIPGYWQWDTDRNDFIWISGFWRNVPPGRQWVPGQYQQVEGGWQWTPGFWADARQSDLTYQPPPPVSLEVGPSEPAPQEDAFYMPGCWVWLEARYRWRPGFWTASVPGWVWSPARYVWSPAGCVFVDGYWDYPLEDRGMLFAPIACDFAQLGPNWTWTPSYCVSADFLPYSLWIGPHRHHYFYGDYYGPRFARAGYSFWRDYRFGKNCPDPLYNYYRIARGGAVWEREVRQVHEARLQGRAPLPARTLSQQLQIVRNSASSVTNVRSLVAVKPLGEAVSRGKFLTVNHGERVQAQRHAQELRSIGVQRATLERRLTGGAPLRTGDSPRSLGLQLPGSHGPARPAVPVTAGSHNTPATGPRHVTPPNPGTVPHDGGVRTHAPQPAQHPSGAPSKFGESHVPPSHLAPRPQGTPPAVHGHQGPVAPAHPITPAAHPSTPGPKEHAPPQHVPAPHQPPHAETRHVQPVHPAAPAVHNPPAPVHHVAAPAHVAPAPVHHSPPAPVHPASSGHAPTPAHSNSKPAPDQHHGK